MASTEKNLSYGKLNQLQMGCAQRSRAIGLSLCALWLSVAPSQIAPQRPPIVLSFSYEDKHIFVVLEDPVLGSLNLLVDTGADRTILWERAIERSVSLRNMTSHHVTTLNGYGNGPQAKSSGTVHVSLKGGQKALFNNRVHIADLKTLAEGIGRPLDGILGWDFFRNWCVRIDYDKHQTLLFDPLECRPTGDQTVVLNNSWSKNGPVFPVAITFANGTRVHALLRMDTGADDAIKLKSSFASKSGLPKNVPLSQKIHGVGINGSYCADTVIASEVSLADGTVQFENATIYIVNSSHRLHSNDGTVGNAVLEKMVITLDPGTRRIYLQPGDALKPQSP